ncbi:MULTISPECIES: DUF3253 domain-containing protein [Streptomyces]|uniref:DUF3253 domain-containing protein n=2 Tax=Streptomyces TaxID=1883 RepID=A0ABV9ILB9_9ACTN
MSASDRILENAILDMPDRRAPGASVCPSEVARAIRRGPDEEWRDLMEPVRRAAARLATSGLVVVTQRGVTVDASDVAAHTPRGARVRAGAQTATAVMDSGRVPVAPVRLSCRAPSRWTGCRCR